MTRIVVIGGGFGGLAVVQAMRRDPVQITLIDRRNHHLFQPLLYQVATAALAPSDIAEPIRAILAKQRNVDVRLGHVDEVDLAGKRLRISDDWVAWDKLVIAAGVRHAYFGNDQWEQFAPGLKTIGDALAIRQKILTAFERAEWIPDDAARRACLTFVVVGGGPTGVELAGAIAEIAFQTLRNDFKHLDTRLARVVLVEGTGNVLNGFPSDLQDKARAQLERLGVQLRFNTFVTGVDEQGVTLGDERLHASTVLWAAGVAAPPLTATLGVPLHRNGRVPVNPDLSIPGHPDAYVIGDLAVLEQDGAELPGVAPVALTMGRHVAKNLRNGGTSPFRYWDKGHLATIGRSKAVGFAGKLHMSGFIAWVLWVFVHLMVLVTYRNRLLVFIKWAWAYVTFERASRLIWRDETPNK
jgi:NADH dehydrogenase